MKRGRSGASAMVPLLPIIVGGAWQLPRAVAGIIVHCLRGPAELRVKSGRLHGRGHRRSNHYSDCERAWVKAKPRQI